MSDNVYTVKVSDESGIRQTAQDNSPEFRRQLSLISLESERGRFVAPYQPGRNQERPGSAALREMFPNLTPSYSDSDVAFQMVENGRRLDRYWVAVCVGRAHGATISHCGHATANWPYFITIDTENLKGEWSSSQICVIGMNGRGFRKVTAAKEALRRWNRGELELLFGFPGRTDLCAFEMVSDNE